MRPSWSEYFMHMAHVASSRATCLRRQVGAVLVKNNQVIATGYNGAPAGALSCDDKGKCLRKEQNVPPGTRYEICESVHAEANALVQAARHSGGAEGATLYITAPPCKMCARLIVNAGVARVVYLGAEDYRREDTGLDLLCGIELLEVS